MILDVYIVEYESQRYGSTEENNLYRFDNKEARDKYFNFLVNRHKNIAELILDEKESDNNAVYFDDKIGKWSYIIYSYESTVKIIKSIEVINDTEHFKY
jgi:hypothetical protein